MKFISPERWRATLLAYAVGGLLLGLANPLLNRAAAHWGIRAGWGTAVSVNGLMPLLAVALAVSYPRTGVAALGGVLSAAAFHLGLSLAIIGDPVRGMATATLRAPHPILVVAALGYAVVGMIASAVVRPWRRVGLADAQLRCAKCGYFVIGLSRPRCPECGEDFEARAVTAVPGETPAATDSAKKGE